jgi:hypothetical protein
LAARVVVEGVVQLPVSEGFLLEVPETAPQVAQPEVFLAAALEGRSLLPVLAVSAASSSNTSSHKEKTT